MVRDLREIFPITKRYVYLNHAGYSPPPKPVLEAVKEHLDKLQREILDLSVMESVRDEVALIPNTTLGLNIVANALPVKKGDNIVISDMEFPSNVLPWLSLQQKGVEIRYAKSVNGLLHVDAYEKVIDDSTLAVSISYVTFINGFRHDVRAIADIAHSHGAFLIIDGIQALGAIKVDVKLDDIDFLSCGGAKWLLSPFGTGFLYVKRELIDELEPPLPGWANMDPLIYEKGLREGFDFSNLKWAKGSRRFDSGTLSFASFIGLREALRLLNKIGMDNIEKRILKLTGEIVEELMNLNVEVTTPREERHRAGIVHFLIKNPTIMTKTLLENKIIVAVRNRGVRVSPHFYNTEEELEKFLSIIKKYLKS